MDHTRLSDELAHVLAVHGLELDELELTPAGKRRVVRVTVDGDGPKGHGPDLDQIADATRAISAHLDESDTLGEQPYTLEVSSRGVSRPLTRPAHYRRNAGRLVQLTLNSGAEVTGRISAADERCVTLDVDGVPATHEFNEIGKAVVQIEMNRRLDDQNDGE